MRIRATAILIQNECLAVMERQRGGRHYFTFPGGGVDAGESETQAVVREVDEELGVQVRVTRHVATVWFRGNRQEFFLVEQVGGIFGSGTGEEFSAEHNPTHGTYHPMWMPIAEVTSNLVLPKQVAALVAQSHVQGWPPRRVTIHEEET